MNLNVIKFDAGKQGTPLKPIWKKLITAGRANEGLRADWRAQLAGLQQEIGFEYIRFHGIFHDDMMVYTEDACGNAQYNWQYIDSLLDFLLSIHLRPMLELSFTPNAMRSGDDTFFWWKCNITPPKDYDKWCNLVEELVKHCMNRYGKKEVSNWYFEVWNEPNLEFFWTGTQEEYFKLYECTAKSIKKIDPDFKVGGPASSGSMNDEKAPWVEDFLAFCEERKLPVDFISTHPYPNYFPVIDSVKPCYRDENGTYDSLVWLKKTVEGSKYKNAEIHITEWNSSPSPRDLVHDTAFMAPFIIQNNIRCMGLADSLGFWDFTDIFEENGAATSIFHGGFGLINAQGLEKPSYHGYWFLSRLGDEILDRGESHIVTRKDDRIHILIWNYCHYNQTFCEGDSTGITLHDRYGIFIENGDLKFKIEADNIHGKYKVIHYFMDRENGSIYDTWMVNGAPESPDKDEMEILRQNMRPKGSVSYCETTGAYNTEITVKPHGAAYVELRRLY